MSSTDNTKGSSKDTRYAATPVQIGMGMLILGASAGLTLYTKKTHSMLAQLKRAEQNKQMRLPKKMYGPPTKQEWEKLRSRWTEDDL